MIQLLFLGATPPLHKRKAHCPSLKTVFRPETRRLLLQRRTKRNRMSPNPKVKPNTRRAQPITDHGAPGLVREQPQQLGTIQWGSGGESNQRERGSGAEVTICQRTAVTPAETSSLSPLPPPPSTLQGVRLRRSVTHR